MTRLLDSSLLVWLGFVFAMVYVREVHAGLDRSAVKHAARFSLPNALGRALRVRSAINESIDARGQATDWKKRDGSARFTFFPPGIGACGIVNTASDFIVAINGEQYDNGANCFKTVTLEFNGNTVEAQITDECPNCPYDALDLSPAVFQVLADPGLGEIWGSWSFGSGNSAPTTTSKAKATPTSTSTSISRSTVPATTKKLTTSTTSSSTTSPTSTSASPTPSSLDPSTNALDAINGAVIQIAALIAVGNQAGDLVSIDD